MGRRKLFAGLMSASLVMFFVLLLCTSLRAKKPVLEGENAKIERCAECHETQVEAFQTSVHGKKGFELRSDKACACTWAPWNPATGTMWDSWSSSGAFSFRSPKR